MTTVHTYMWRPIRARITDLRGVVLSVDPTECQNMELRQNGFGWVYCPLAVTSKPFLDATLSIDISLLQSWLKVELAWPFHDYYHCKNHQIELRTSITAKPQWRNVTTYRNLRITNKGQRERKADLSVWSRESDCNRKTQVFKCSYISLTQSALSLHLAANP
jgi:hypothetical protein